jgi:hypothetical protein
VPNTDDVLTVDIGRSPYDALERILDMFEAADESYAPANANENIRSAATAVIGHHDDEGIARFLRERFALDRPR